MPLQVLTRRISPYDGPELFLGFFSDASKAQVARDAYLKGVSLAESVAQAVVQDCGPRG
jgi:hypothetical protein